MDSVDSMEDGGSVEKRMAAKSWLVVKGVTGGEGELAVPAWCLRCLRCLRCFRCLRCLSRRGWMDTHLARSMNQHKLRGRVWMRERVGGCGDYEAARLALAGGLLQSVRCVLYGATDGRGGTRRRVRRRTKGWSLIRKEGA